jgi:hypothetical protein
MTLTEIRDELARLAGWHRHEVHGNWVKPDRRPWTEASDNHPIPATLEEAAKLPDGWSWWRHHWQGRTVWHGCDGRPFASSPFVPDTGNELYDRFALRLACERAERNQQ